MSTEEDPKTTAAPKDSDSEPEDKMKTLAEVTESQGKTEHSKWRKSLFSTSNIRLFLVVAIAVVNVITLLHLEFVNSITLDFAFYDVGALKKTDYEGCPDNIETTSIGVTFTEIIEVLNDLECDYNLHGGTLLNFIRDCEMRDTDIDIAISIDWLRQNEQTLAGRLREAGFMYPMARFGKIDRPGYEVAVGKRSVKVDLFSRIEEPDRYVTSLWKEGKAYNCYGFRDRYAISKWGNLKVRIPEPFDSTLTGYYGKDWRLPYEGVWHWFEDAFRVGKCEGWPELSDAHGTPQRK